MATRRGIMPPMRNAAGRSFFILISAFLFANCSPAPVTSGAAPAAARLKSIDDLKDKRIGVQIGTVYDLYATQTFPKATVVLFSTYRQPPISTLFPYTTLFRSDVDTLVEVMAANPDLVRFG